MASQEPLELNETWGIPVCPLEKRSVSWHNLDRDQQNRWFHILASQQRGSVHKEGSDSVNNAIEENQPTWFKSYQATSASSGHSCRPYC